MSPLLRRILAVLAGLALAMLIITVFEAVSGQLYSAPTNLDLSNKEVLAAYLGTLPVSALLLVLAGYGVAGFAGGWLTTRISGAVSTQPALIVGAILLGASLMNLRAIPHPAWFGAVNLALVIAMPLAGARLAGRRMVTG